MTGEQEPVGNNGHASLQNYLAVKNAPAVQEMGRHGFDPWVGRSPGGRNGNPLQYSCPENAMDREAWQATVPRVTKNQTQLST